MKVRAQVAADAAKLKQSRGIIPGLAAVRVGDDPASRTYVASKRKAAEEVGFRSWEHQFNESISREELLQTIRRLNADSTVHGILVQLPLPKHLDPHEMISAVSPQKDVDGFHPVNAGNLFLGHPGLRPCTPLGIMRLLAEIDCKPSGQRAVVVGRSIIVGKPIAMLLLEANATVTLCHRKSDLPQEVARGDIVVAAAGAPELIKGSWIKPGAVVIDVGINRTPLGKLVGDVEFRSAVERASFITPVPGGVGPMTVAMLMHNTLMAAAAT
jgi:methylenetetrahydrofolate dehydrogenase (NADP+)/methenyltetrahydrofolate cyclohydrolase